MDIYFHHNIKSRGGDHNLSIVFYALLFLAISASPGRYSIDYLLRKQKFLPAQSLSTWPIMINRWTLCLLFFFAGINKLRQSGLDWIFSDNVSNLIKYYSFYWNNSTALVIAELAWLCYSVALFVILFEVTSLYALFSRRYRRVFVFLLVLFFITVKLGFNEDFFAIAPLLGAFAPWSRIDKYLARIVVPVS